MKKFSKYYLILFCLSVLLSITGCSSEPIGNIGENEMFAYEMQFFLMSAREEIERYYGANDAASKAKFWESNEIRTNINEIVAQIREGAIDQLKKHKIMIAEAKKKSFKLSSKDEKEINDQIEKEIKDSGGEKEFLIMLEKEFEGITIEKYKQLQFDVYFLNKYYDDLLKKMSITDGEIKKYYEKNKDAYDYTKVRHILIQTRNEKGAKLSDAKLKEAKEKADEILKKLNDGEDMIKLVAAYSEDPSKTQNNGEFDVNKQNKNLEPIPEYREWALNAKVGDMEVVETQYGYYVVKCEKKSTIDDKDVKELIETSLQQNKVLESVEKLSEKSEYRMIYDSEKISTLNIPGLSGL